MLDLLTTIQRKFNLTKATVRGIDPASHYHTVTALSMLRLMSDLLASENKGHQNLGRALLSFSGILHPDARPSPETPEIRPDGFLGNPARKGTRIRFTLSPQAIAELDPQYKAAVLQPVQRKALLQSIRSSFGVEPSSVQGGETGLRAGGQPINVPSIAMARELVPGYQEPLKIHAHAYSQPVPVGDIYAQRGAIGEAGVMRDEAGRILRKTRMADEGPNIPVQPYSQQEAQMYDRIVKLFGEPSTVMRQADPKGGLSNTFTYEGGPHLKEAHPTGAGKAMGISLKFFPDSEGVFLNIPYGVGRAHMFHASDGFRSIPLSTIETAVKVAHPQVTPQILDMAAKGLIARHVEHHLSRESSPPERSIQAEVGKAMIAPSQTASKMLNRFMGM